MKNYVFTLIVTVALAITAVPSEAHGWFWNNTPEKLMQELISEKSTEARMQSVEA
jgi:hypothetical protein